MRVSVIIPLFNKRSSIRRALESVARQSFEDFELIVVDDGSTDGSSEIVRQFPDSRIAIHSQRNAGPGAARNAGIGRARGELVAFLDADDEWMPGYLQESVDMLDAAGPEVAAAVSGYFEFPSGTSTEEMWRRRGLRNGKVAVSELSSPQTLVYQLAFMSSWSTVIRKDAVLRWGGFYSRNRCRYGEDSYLWLKVLLNERVLFDLTPRVRYHRETSELTVAREGPRPVEPLLTDPGELWMACPPRLKAVLGEVLALRAAKTACMLGYWGHWPEARRLLKLYPPRLFAHFALSAPAFICATPLGGALGRIHRFWMSTRGSRTKNQLRIEAPPEEAIA